MITNIRHAGIVIKDLDASLKFYQDLLGFKIEKEMDESGEYIDNMLALDGVKVKTIKMKSPDGAMIELLHYQSHAGQELEKQLCDIGLTHVAFTVSDLDKAYHLLTEKGVVFNAPPQLSPDGYAKVTFCKAPEGTYIELVEVLK